MTKSEFEAHIKRLEEQNAFMHSEMEALGQKIDLLSRNFGEINSTSPLFQRNVYGSFSVPTLELGLDGPIQGDHMIAMEHGQVGHNQG